MTAAQPPVAHAARARAIGRCNAIANHCGAGCSVGCNGPGPTPTAARARVVGAYVRDVAPTGLRRSARLSDGRAGTCRRSAGAGAGRFAQRRRHQRHRATRWYRRKRATSGTPTVQQLVEAQAVTALARELALQSQLVGRDTDQWILRVERESLQQPGSRERLATALAGHRSCGHAGGRDRPGHGQSGAAQCGGRGRAATGGREDHFRRPVRAVDDA